jgi:ABC-type phosphate/phosphonate transport system permease subunit
VKHYLVLILNFFLLAVPSTLVWGAAEKAEALDKKIGNLDKLSGLNYFFASWYNDNMWLYAIMVTALMGVIGLLIALVTDIILKMIGMEVHKMEHHE